MRNLLAMFLSISMVSFAVAGETDCELLTVASGTNATLLLADTAPALRGYIDEIRFVAPAAATSDVTLAWVPAYAGFDAVVLARITNCSASFIVRPVVPSTDATGVALDATNVVNQFPLVGGTLRLTVTNLCTSNLTWSALVRYCK